MANLRFAAFGRTRLLIFSQCEFVYPTASRSKHKAHPVIGWALRLAEAVGFEPTDPAKGLPDFESGPL